MAIRDVVIELGGQSKVLRCDLACWAAVEDHKGRRFLEMVKTFGPEMAFRDLQIMLWAMLGGPDGPPLKDVGKWVTGENLVMVLEKIGEVLKDAFPKAVPNPPEASANGAGTLPDPTPLVSDSFPTSSGD